MPGMPAVACRRGSRRPRPRRGCRWLHADERASSCTMHAERAWCCHAARSTALAVRGAFYLRQPSAGQAARGDRQTVVEVVTPPLLSADVGERSLKRPTEVHPRKAPESTARSVRLSTGALQGRGESNPTVRTDGTVHHYRRYSTWYQRGKFSAASGRCRDDSGAFIV